MDHFVDIDLRPDPEFSVSHLMSALYDKLHRVLVKLDSTGVGVSFPGRDDAVPHLGKTLRLHGRLETLTVLMASEWLAGMRDHVIARSPRPVPAGSTHRCVRRVQAKSNPARLRRRLIRRHGLSAHEALQRIPDSAVELIRLPFVQLRSASTEQTFRLFIAHDPDQPEAIAGAFNAYGLSQTATIPWF